MIEAFRGVSLADLTAALDGPLRRLRAPEPDVRIRGVVLHTPGDPQPDPGMLVLCTTPERGVLNAVALAVREHAAAGALAAAPEPAAVFTVPDGDRWSDAYDQVRQTLRD